VTARARLAAVTAAAVVAGVPALAAAQSTRYPRPPVDAEAEAERRSAFWEEVVRPGAGRYDHLVTAATDVLKVLRSGDPTRARDLLREAVALRADRADGWGYLGVATERLRDYRGCADAYAKAYAIDPAWRPARLASPGDVSASARVASTRPLPLALAVCLARSGDLARATRELEGLVARGERLPELFINLGQVHMAAGRINDAIVAFGRAVDEQRSGDALGRWLLAVAYDRARRPAAAAAAAEQAAAIDPNVTAAGGAVPLIPPADAFYLQAIGARARPEQARPEVAVVSFRRYLEAAPEASPWRARAAEHLAAIGTVDLAARASLEGAGDAEVMRAAVRGAAPALRKCLAELPTVMIELRITQVGPPGRAAATPSRRAPAPPRGAPAPGRPAAIGRRPPDAQSPGVHAHVVISSDLGDRAGLLERAIACVEQVGQGIALPRPPADTYATLRVPVIGD